MFAESGKLTYRVDREIVDEPRSPSQSIRTMNLKSSSSLKSLFNVEAKVEGSIEVPVILQVHPSMDKSWSDLAGPSSIAFA